MSLSHVMRMPNPSNPSTPQFLNLCDNFNPFQQVQETQVWEGTLQNFDYNVVAHMVDLNTFLERKGKKLVAKFDSTTSACDGLVG